MTQITYADKTVGGTFVAADANEIKTAVNSKQDDLSPGLTLGQILYFDGTDITPATGLTYDPSTYQLKLHGRIVDRTNSIVIESTTVENTLVETTIWTGAIAAGTLQAENYIKYDASGVISNAGPTDDVTINIYLGSTLIKTFAPEIGQVTNENWHVSGQMTVRTIGVSGVIASQAHIEISDHSNTVSGVIAANTAEAQDITIKILWGAEDVANVVTLYQAALEYKH